MKDVLIVLILVVIIALATIYIYKAKKRGARCIGCPHSKECGLCNKGCHHTGPEA